jgi:hypothetical protein
MICIQDFSGGIYFIFELTVQPSQIKNKPADLLSFTQ